MATRVDEDIKLLELLNRHPELKQRVRALADIAADSDGDLVRADEAERRVIEEVRRIGQEALHGWAEERIARGEEGAATLIFMVLAALWAPQITRFPSLWQYLQSILSYVTPPIVAIFLLGLFWRRASATGAVATLGAGVTIGAVT